MKRKKMEKMPFVNTKCWENDMWKKWKTQNRVRQLYLWWYRAVERSMAKVKSKRIRYQKRNKYSIDDWAVAFTLRKVVQTAQNISHSLNSFAYQKQQLVAYVRSKNEEKTRNSRYKWYRVCCWWSICPATLSHTVCIYVLLGLRQVSNVR